MSRPLMQYGVGHLEEMFTKGKADPKVLKQLENELQHRQVPRAVALLTEVRATMHSNTSVANPIVNPPLVAVTVTTVSEQHALFENPSASLNVVVQKNSRGSDAANFCSAYISEAVDARDRCHIRGRRLQAAESDAWVNVGIN